jgi:hypothetical protein
LQNITLANGRAAGNATAANGSSILALDQGFDPGLTATDAVVIAENVTFQDNIANLTCGVGCNDEYDFGGAIYSLLSRVEVRDSTFNGNQAQNAAGGAIHILQSTLLVENTTFTNNTAIGGGQGGTIYIDGVSGAAGFATIRDSRFSGGRTHNAGGAIYVNLYENTTALTIERSSFVDNAVIDGFRATGGAIAGGSSANGAGTGNARITITESLFSNNRVDRPPGPNVGDDDGSGGALGFDQRAIVTIANSTFTGNRAEGTGFNANGGAIYIVNNTTPFQIINSTIADNFAGWVGGGIANAPLGGTSTTPGGTITNVLFSNNTADNGPNTWDIQQHCSVIQVGGNAYYALADGGGNFQHPPRNPNMNFWNERNCTGSINTANPILLGPLADNAGPTQTRALLAGSPAIDTGAGAACSAAPVSNRDQRGFTRPVDGDGLGGAACDSGAFEFAPNQPPGTPTLLNPVNGASITGTTTMFSWNAAAFASSYRLELDDNSDFSSLLSSQTQGGTSFTPAFIGGGVFYWRVIAINSNGETPGSSRTFTLNSATTEAPIRNRIASGAPLTWLGINDPAVTGYQVQVARDAAFSQLVTLNPDTVAQGVYQISPTLPPGIYYWRVRAMRGATPGAWSAAETVAVGVGG